MRSFVRSYTGTQFPQSQEGEKKEPGDCAGQCTVIITVLRQSEKNAVPTTVGHKMEWNGRCWGPFLGAGLQGDGRRGIRPKEMTKKQKE